MTYLSATETAKNVRAALKEAFGKGTAFEGVKFSVRKRGCSVDVEYTDGPSTDAVDAVVDQFERVSRCHATGEILSGGNIFISVQQNLSADVQARMEDAVSSYYSNWEEMHWTQQQHFRSDFLSRFWDYTTHTLNQAAIDQEEAERQAYFAQRNAERAQEEAAAQAPLALVTSAPASFTIITEAPKLEPVTLASREEQAQAMADDLAKAIAAYALEQKLDLSQSPERILMRYLNRAAVAA
jgi:hypothetical protein